MTYPNEPVNYTNTSQSRFINELKEFVHFPSVSAAPENARDVAECADWLASHLRHAGLNKIEVRPTARHPIVYAESLQRPQRPTVLIYGHYDVQPPDPLHEWKSPPLDPVVRGTSLYGRGACADKGQMFVHVKAIEAYLRTQRALPVNVKCLFEGEEEIGSPNLPGFLSRYQHRLAADAAVIPDMSIVAPDRPAITHALRGALSVEIEVTGGKQYLHSGTFGGAVHNLLQVLAELLVALHHPNGKIAIPGFYYRVRLWNEDERAYMARVGPTDEKLFDDARARVGWGEMDYTAYERTTIRPAPSVNGMPAGIKGRTPKP